MRRNAKCRSYCVVHQEPRDALHFLSEGKAIPTMMDLSALDAQRNRIGIWHCGACPTRILKKNTQYRCTRHSILENGNPETAVGLMVEFLLETGPATVVRYQSPDASTMFAFEGDLVESAMPFRGAWCEMEVTAPGNAVQVMGTILDEGLDHHWSLGYGHWLEDLRMFNHWLGVVEHPVREQRMPYGLSRRGSI
jgi:L-fucose isomerase-like protein